MNLAELKKEVVRAMKNAIDNGEDPKKIKVSIQADMAGNGAAWSDDIELKYDNDVQACGCVLYGTANGFPIPEKINLELIRDILMEISNRGHGKKYDWHNDPCGIVKLEDFVFMTLDRFIDEI